MSDLGTPTPSYISHPTHPIVSLQYPYTQLHISPHSPHCLTSVPLHPVTYFTPLTPLSHFSTPTPSYISYPTHLIVSLQYPYIQLHILPHSPHCLTSVPLHPVTYLTPLTPLSHFSTPTPSYISYPTHPIVSLQYPYTQLYILPHSPHCLTSVPLHPVTYFTPLTPLSHFSTPTPSYISYPTHPIVSLQYPYTQLHISPHSPLCLTSVPLHPVTYFTPLTPVSDLSTATPSYIFHPTHPCVWPQYLYT